LAGERTKGREGEKGVHDDGKQNKKVREAKGKIHRRSPGEKGLDFQKKSRQMGKKGVCKKGLVSAWGTRKAPKLYLAFAQEVAQDAWERGRGGEVQGDLSGGRFRHLKKVSKIDTEGKDTEFIIAKRGPSEKRITSLASRATRRLLQL